MAARPHLQANDLCSSLLLLTSSLLTNDAWGFIIIVGIGNIFLLIFLGDNIFDLNRVDIHFTSNSLKSCRIMYLQEEWNFLE